MVEGNSELKRHAIHALEAGRHELSVETAELKHQMNPKVVARRVVKNHPTALIVTSVVAGMVMAALIWRRSSRHSLKAEFPKFKLQQASEPKAGAAALLAGLVIKNVLPFVGRQIWSKFVDQRRQQSKHSRSVDATGSR